MKPYIPCFTVALLLANVATAQDFDAGLRAYESGDYDAAVNEWLPLAKKGNASAQLELGKLYRVGRGVEVDHSAAARWHHLAATKGEAEAQKLLGAYYIMGEGVLQDFVMAHMWLNISCANGHQQGCNVRRVFEKNLIPADISEAQRRARICMESKYQSCD